MERNALKVVCQCGRTHRISEAKIVSLASVIRADRASRSSWGVPKKLQECPYCHEKMGTKALQVHRAQCPLNPYQGKKRGPAPIYRECKYCHKKFATAELRVHVAECPVRFRKAEPVLVAK